MSREERTDKAEKNLENAVLLANLEHYEKASGEALKANEEYKKLKRENPLPEVANMFREGIIFSGLLFGQLQTKTNSYFSAKTLFEEVEKEAKNSYEMSGAEAKVYLSFIHHVTAGSRSGLSEKPPISNHKLEESMSSKTEEEKASLYNLLGSLYMEKGFYKHARKVFNHVKALSDGNEIAEKELENINNALEGEKNIRLGAVVEAKGYSAPSLGREISYKTFIGKPDSNNPMDYVWHENTLRRN